jgi:hypothetical protein
MTHNGRHFLGEPSTPVVENYVKAAWVTGDLCAPAMARTN